MPDEYTSPLVQSLADPGAAVAPPPPKFASPLVSALASDASYTPAAPDMAGESRDRALLRQARVRASEMDEPTGLYLLRRSIPGSSAVANVLLDREFGKAQKRFADGNAKESDYDFIAQMERLKQLEANRTTGESVVSGLAQVPAIVGETLAGGAVAGRLGAVVGRVAPGFAGSTLGGVLGSASRTGVVAAAPSMFLPQGVERNVAEGREAFDIKGLAPAYALSYLNAAVLGRVAGRVGGGPIPGRVGRAAVSTAVGVGLEQPAVDAAGGLADEVLPDAYKLRTHYGLYGQLLRGEFGPAQKTAAVQAATFAAFGLLHGGHDAKRDVLDKYTTALDTLARAGVDPETAGTILTRATDDALNDRPTVRVTGFTVNKGPVAEYTKQLQQTLMLAPHEEGPRQLPPTSEPPPEAPGGPPKPEPPQVGPQPSSAPEASQTRPQSVPAPVAAAVQIRRALERAPNLTPEQRTAYGAAMDRVLAAMPAAAHDRVFLHLREAVFHPDTKTAGLELLDRMMADPLWRDDNPEGSNGHKKALEDRRAVESGEKKVGGGVDGSGRLHVDGDDRGLAYGGPFGMELFGKPDQRMLSHEIYAHEMGHLIDGAWANRYEYSNSPEWLDIYKAEIKPDFRLTAYASEKSSEGFAEFARLLYGSDVPTATIAKEFPRASRFFKDRGLWPAERGGTREKMPEVFAERVGGKGVAHADILKPEVGWGNPREALAAADLERLFAEKGLTDREKAFVLDYVHDNPRLVSRQAVSQTLKKVSAKLGVDLAAVRQGFRQDRVIDLAERGGRVDLTELHADPDAAREKIAKRDKKYATAEAELEALKDQYLKEIERGQLSPERAKYFADRVAALHEQTAPVARRPAGAAQGARGAPAAGQAPGDRGRAPPAPAEAPGGPAEPGRVAKPGRQSKGDFVRQLVRSSGGIKWDDTAATYFDAKSPADAIRQHKLPPGLFTTKNPHASSLDQKAQEMARQGHLASDDPQELADAIIHDRPGRHADLSAEHAARFNTPPEEPPPGAKEQAALEESRKGLTEYGFSPADVAYHEKSVLDIARREPEKQWPSGVENIVQGFEIGGTGGIGNEQKMMRQHFQKLLAAERAKPVPLDPATDFEFGENAPEARRFGGGPTGRPGKITLPGYSGSRLEAIVNHVGDGLRALRDEWEKMAGKMFPAAARRSARTADAMARLVSAQAIAEAGWKYIRKAVFGPLKPEVWAKFYTAHLQARLDYMGSNTSLIGPDSPITTRAEYRQIINSPAFKRYLDRWKAVVVPIMEAHYRDAEGLAPNAPVPSQTQIPGYPVNLVNARPEAASASTIFSGGVGKGRLENVKQGKLGFARQATGVSKRGYETDPEKAIPYALSVGASKAAKAVLYRTAEAEGVGAWAKPGDPLAMPPQPPFIAGEPAVAVRDVDPPKNTQAAAKGQTDFRVAEPLYKDFRNALQTDERPRIPGITPILNFFTRASIASTVEFTFHSANQLTNALRPRVLRELVPTVWGVVRNFGMTEAHLGRLFELSQIGATKEKGFEAGMLLGAKYAHLDPTAWASRFLDGLDNVVRLSMDRAFTKMAAQGLAADTPANRRDFLNQMGQYKYAAQAKIVQLLRATGIGPFATAATNFVAQGIRNLFLSPGLKAATPAAAARLRAERFATLAGAMGGAALLNYALWGRWDGGDDVPLGGVKLFSWGDRTYFVDVGRLTGLTRGLRSVGAMPWLEAALREKDPSTAARVHGSVVDVTHALLHPATGPGVSFGYTALTGKNTLGADVAGKPDEGSVQEWENFKAAVRNANPTLATVLGFDRVRPGESLPFLTPYHGEGAQEELVQRFLRLGEPYLRSRKEIGFEKQRELEEKNAKKR